MLFKINLPIFCLLVICLMVSGSKAHAQRSRTTDLEESILEMLLELLPDDQLDQPDQSGQPDLSDYSERLLSIHAYPFDLNTVSAGELHSLGFLSPLVVGYILEHRHHAGKFLSVNELQAIKGMDLGTARFLSYFVTVRGENPLEGATYRQLAMEGQHELMIRHGRILQRQAGYSIRDTTKSRYLGSPDRVLLRYRYQYAANLRISVNMEKDPGEQFFGRSGQRYGFDFYSGSIQLNNLGKLSSLVLGDYLLQFGQGLGVWQGFSPGKGALMQGIAKQGGGLRPHTSADEVNFFRGAAAAVQWGVFRIVPFISFRQRDGKMELDPAGNKTFTSLGQSGLHRTPNEIANKFGIPMWTYGMNMEVSRRSWKLGGTYYRTSLGADWIPQPVVRNYFTFQGSTLSNVSVYHQFNFRNGYFFGEIAGSDPGGFALLNGALLSLHHHFSIGLLHRYYQRSHHSFFGRAFGEGSAVANEQGFYTGLVYQPNRKVSLVVYHDLFHFPWLKYRIDAPSRGKDLLTEFTYSWSRTTKLSARFRYRESNRNLTGEGPLPTIGLIGRYQYRINFETRGGKGWRIRNRVEYTSYTDGIQSPEYGWMCFQDLFYQPLGAKITGNLRFALFATSSYETRIYAFENDVLHASSFPVYHDRGIRMYLNGRWKLNRRVDIWMRYAVSHYSELSAIGSGLDQLTGAFRSELKTQLRVKIP